MAVVSISRSMQRLFLYEGKPVKHDQTSPPLLTIEQAAEQLQVSRSILYSLIDRGKLACHRVGIGRGTIRIAPSDLEAYLESCRHAERVEEPPVPRRVRLRHIRL